MKKIALCVAMALMIASCSHLQTAKLKPSETIIKRDQYGTPHIYADTVYGLFFGYGYAISQDRLFSMEMAKYSGQGRVAEVLGAGEKDANINFDRRTRSLYDPASIRKQLTQLPPEDKAVFEGYAAGINAYLVEIRKKPDALMPKQFVEFGFEPTPWTAFDVAMIFVGSMVNRFGDFNTELENQMILNGLVNKHGKEKGISIFNQILPRVAPGAPTTISADEWKMAQTDTSDRPIHSSYLAASGDESAEVEPEREFAFSNLIIVGKKKAAGANAILMNGPQFGWYIPSYVYSIGLHGAGFDIVGNSPYGYPAILFGHNGHIAWGSTWGAGDMIDVYREKLNPDRPEEYWFNGRYLTMDKRAETIKIKNGNDIPFNVFRTVHGPVIQMDEKNGIAFAKKRTWEGYEVDTLLGWMHSCRAKNFDQWLKQTERSALNINMYYADKEGNIGYVFTGKYPKRKAGHDNRVPISGEGEMEWEGLHPFTYNPKVYNPKQGYIVNWNNRPAYGVLNPDMFWYSWSKADRVQVLIDAVSKKERLSPDEIWDIVKTSSVADVNARYFLPVIKRAATASGDPIIKDAVAALTEWNLLSQDNDKDGKYDEPATAIFRTFLSLMVEETIKDDLGDVYKFFAGSGYPDEKNPMRSGLNIQIGVKAIVQAILEPKSNSYDFFNGESPEAVANRALTKSVEILKAQLGPDVTHWRLPVARIEFTDNNFLGIPQASKTEIRTIPLAMNRGTENDLVVFGSDGTKAWEVAPPGQSAFVSPAGEKSPHYDDQLEMYTNYGKKRTWLTPQEIEQNTKSVIKLTY